MKVELHADRFGGKPRDITPWTRSVSWTDAQSGPPHQTCQLSVMWAVHLPPADVGDWLVVRLSDNTPAVFWGMVISAATSITPGREGRWSMSAIGWFDVLGKADLIISEDIYPRDEIGTLFSVLTGAALATSEDGAAALTEAAQSAFGVPASSDFAFETEKQAWLSASRALDYFIRHAARLALPNSLGGGFLSEVVRVVYDQDSANAYAGDGTAERKGQAGRQVEAIPGAVEVHLQPNMSSTKVASYAQGTWGIDPMIGEMFPSLEDFGKLTQDEYDLSRAERAGLSLDALRRGERLEDAASGSGGVLPGGTGPNFQRTSAARRAAEKRVAEIAKANPGDLPFIDDGVSHARSSRPVPGVAERIGRNPVLIYRMRPWRVTPLQTWADRLTAYDGRFQPITTAIRRVSESVAQRFQDVTWSPIRAAKLTSSDVESVDVSVDESGLATIFTASEPGTDGPPVWFTNLGLPMIDKLAQAIGARQYTFTWPFFRSFSDLGPDPTGAPNAATLSDEVVMIVAQGMQFAMRVNRFLSGTISCKSFRPDVRIGEPVTYTTGTGPALTGYVESTTNTVEIAGDGSGQIARATTRLTVTRAMWDESYRDYPPSLLVTLPMSAPLRRARRGREG